MVVFLYFRKKFSTNSGHNSFILMMGMLHEVRDEANKIHDIGSYRVPKSAQTGPLKQKIYIFFIVTPNLKWKFLIDATSFMKNSMALPKQLHWENPRIAEKNHGF